MSEQLTVVGETAGMVVANAISNAMNRLRPGTPEKTAGIIEALAIVLAEIELMSRYGVAATLAPKTALCVRELADELLDAARRGAELRAASFAKGGEA